MAAQALGGGLDGRAVLVAQLAVQDDEGGRPRALSRYRRSIALIAQQLVREADPARRDSLLKFAGLYQARAIDLAAAYGLAAASADRADLTHSEVCAELIGRPEPSPPPRSSHGDGDLLRAALADSPSARRPPPPPPPAADGTGGPGEAWRRTYWLLDALRGSIAGGGYLTADGSLFVPAAVWLQRGARLAALPAKSAALDELCEHTASLRGLVGGDDGELLLRELASYCEVLDALQDRLAKALPPSCRVPPLLSGAAAAATAAPPPPQRAPTEPLALGERMRGLGQFVAKTASTFVGAPSAGAVCADSSAYAQLLHRTLAELPVLPALHDACAADGAAEALRHALPLLHRAHAFAHDVVLAIVADDFAQLLSRYLRKAEAAFINGAQGAG
jgi:hypothetical protein